MEKAKSFTPVSFTKLSVKIYNQIHDAIISGAYKAGERLPSERELCTIFKVSRVFVREALATLCCNGLVISVQGVGTFITNYNCKQRGY